MMGFLDIHKDSEVQLRPNFQEKEFYLGHISEAWNRISSMPTYHPLDEKLVDAAQFIRSYLTERSGKNVPVFINSTWRDQDYPNGAKNSQHKLGRALDLDLNPKDDVFLSHIKYDLVNRGEIYHYLRQLGINGFIIYDGFLHLDTRQEKTKYTDEYGQYQFIDNSQALRASAYSFPNEYTQAITASEYGTEGSHTESVFTGGIPIGNSTVINPAQIVTGIYNSIANENEDGMRAFNWKPVLLIAGSIITAIGLYIYTRL